ncbi:MAG: hypothetical protein QNJ81_05340 [Acidimicrobiia bacterium]|nr:hypothetical protein [Acidimicrobiia bacterium]
MRKLLMVLVLAVLAAACGDSAETTDTPAPTASPQPTESSQPAQDEGGDDAAPETSTAPAQDQNEDVPPATSGAPSFDGPPAADFQLALGDGSTFSLSGEEKPVYMVFWAEW